MRRRCDPLHAGRGLQEGLRQDLEQQQQQQQQQEEEGGEVVLALLWIRSSQSSENGPARSGWV